MYDIVSIGGTALDVFLEVHEATVNCRIDNKDCQLCLNYADKIPVKKVTDVPGVGTAPNNAVGSARLGLKAALYTVIGDDSAGKDSLEVFKKEKVSTKYVVIDKKNRTDYSSILSFKGERTLLTFQVPREYSLPSGIKTKWMFLGALPDGHELLHSQVVKKAKKEKIKVGYNPGAHELRDGIDGMRELLKVLEVFIVNKEEAWRLIGKDEDIKILLTKLRKYGPKLVVITDGKNGAYCFDGENFYHQPIFAMPVIEKTGAGDAFATGLISALIGGLDVKTALRYGAANSASVVGYVGAQSGLLTKSQIKKFLDSHKETRPDII